jgi:hypothetical protein
MNQNKLEEILRFHKLWLAGDKEGRQADLRGSDLTGANLLRAELSYAVLTGADLTGADLRYANLRGAGLTDANLTNANLTGADLRYANLRGADLSYADLFGANLVKANLTRANLTDANLTDAKLRDADLTDAIFRSNKLSEQTKNPSYGENTMNFTVTKKSPSKIIKGYYNDINLFLRVEDTLGEFGAERDIEGNPTESSWIQYGRQLDNINVVFLPLNKQWAGYTVIYEDEIVTITL